MSEPDVTRDVVGVGFGPGNLGLAIALSESHSDAYTTPVDAVFLERGERFAWHPGMLLPGTNMQISFLKDLVSQRNPRSRFTFINYLLEHGRLTGFINRQTFTPERVEFADYLRWVAHNVDADVRYGREVIAIEPAGEGDPADARFRVIARVGGTLETYWARTVVVARGLQERLPQWASEPAVANSGRVFHNHRLLGHLAALDFSLDGANMLVVGAGQSAAEAVNHLYNAGARVTSAIRSYGFAPADDSPFANQVFDPGAVDDFFDAPGDVRADLRGRHRYTNYACVETELLAHLHDCHYRESVTGENRLRFERAATVTSAAMEVDGTVRVNIYDRIHDRTESHTYDGVVCATGFTSRGIRGISAFGESCEVTRDYHAVIDGTHIDGLFVQGATEETHGLGSTLLSNIAIRSGELQAAIAGDLARRPVLLSRS